MKKQGAKTAVPRLRFPEFREGSWGRIPGGELFESVSVRNSEAGLPILAITQEHGAIPRDLIDYHVSVTDKSIESYKVVERGDFIISLRSFQGGIEYSNYRGICSPAYVILRRTGEGTSQYFKHLFKSDRFIQQLTRNIEGLRDGKMISYKQFSEQLIPMPAPAEQQKIADCLTSLDEVIAAQGRKVEALKAHKRGLMQQLFPREGETRPRLRFPEFRNAPEWKKVPLGELGEVITGKTPSTTDADLWGGDVLFITPTDIHEGHKYQRSTQRTVVATPKLKVLPPGSIAYTCIASIGKLAITVRPSITNQQINSVVTLPKISNEFVYYALENLTPWIKSIPASSTLAIINKTEFSGIEIWIPVDGSEQKVVADCLASLDTQITAESNQLAALKTHKQGLMQQLFPAPESV